ncbi:NADP-dependent oxidoreductase [Pendulispora albinea]|uniref:NADP-dependent oxidoreductase n=1 Tax=Pendulispora albinea TaxID=2741071 RepID=A0ABZ2LMA6_9BACT
MSDGLVNRQIVLKSRPIGAATVDNFELVRTPVPSLASGDGENAAGQVLSRTLWLSLDPYMNVRIRGKTYAEPVPIGGVIVGRTVGRVIESRHPDYAPGDIVLTPGGVPGWQDYVVSTPERKVDPSLGPISTALGALGMPGKTAYVGLLDIGQPKAGETVVVSSAAGAVGSLAGQMARLRGARVVGIAGGPEKCRYVREELGFDACVDYRAADFAEALARACPKGIDVYFENVGGDVLQTVWPLLNDFARVPVCGLLAEYDDMSPRPGPSMRSVLNKRLTLQGFIVSDPAHLERTGDFLRDTSSWLRQGQVTLRQDVVEGLERAPEGLVGLLAGRYSGKLVVRVAE